MLGFLDSSHIVQGAFIILSIIIGIYVYKDAKSIGKNAVLWTIVALFVPLYIGLIVYLIQSDKKIKTSDCGTELLTQINADDTRPKRRKKLAGIIVTAVVITLLVLTIIFAPFLPIFKSHSSWSAASLGFELNQNECPVYIKDWIKDCDTKGKGIYVLKLSPLKAKFLIEQSPTSLHENEDEIENRYDACVYFNDMMLKSIADEVSPGTIKLSYDSAADKNDITTSRLTGSYAFNYDVKGIKIIIDGRETEYSLSELE